VNFVGRLACASLIAFAALLLYISSPARSSVHASSVTAWAQWGQNAQHTGTALAIGQTLQHKYAVIQYDPFVPQEMAEGHGALLTHYQVALINGSSVFMELKTGAYTPCDPPGSGEPFPCGPDNWQSEVWNEAAWHWQGNRLVPLWQFASDWKPVPNSGIEPTNRNLHGWEPTFQPALSGSFIYVPGAGGTVYKLNQSDGSVAKQIDPFGGGDPSKFVVGGITVDQAGNVYYDVMQLNVEWPWDNDVENSWLVKVAPDDSATTVTYQTLLPGAPTACTGVFSQNQLPWPPSKNAKPGTLQCGSPRAALNVAPAISQDGSVIYTVARGHFWGRDSYLIAVNSSDLSLRWSTAMQQLLNDGCNVLLPPDGQPGGCSIYGATGVDPTQNLPGSAIVSDQASSSPVVAPDGSILFGANTAYNYGRGHMLKFSSSGSFLTSYDFGWDTTPSIYQHGGTYSVVLKDNHYDVGSYCNDPTYCPKAKPGPYYITQLDSNLKIQWQFKDPAKDAHHPNGYEWCVNAPAVDTHGMVFANSEDGNLYGIFQGGKAGQRTFMSQVLDAGYTPLSVDGNGMIYTENAGYLLVIGEIPE